ncbi:hypothetical protein Rsub_12933 [Raphidocelis subcapitata]|uniref:HMG box domain-containing protein n=1 Tax=Raphidocelis subcapitata TaxID=307507 RepID=A0A2V0PS74_9CHLO|nr:hypothetical protein Rsub_12933 [Raphidocelis subcapitata]|eukprot:GBG00176.1 hypothetical protein Rsub_12933 [Raphidocelis subcapitata]
MTRRRRVSGPSLVAGLVLLACRGACFDPCAPIEPLKKEPGASFVVGLAFWPGAREADWGSPEGGVNACDPAQRANLTALGVRFAAFSARLDQLSVLRTTFAEQLALAAAAGPRAPQVVSAVAFRGGVRSEARYVASGDAAVTGGTGFVATLSLMSKFERGVLRYLQFYNLTCNDCGGAGGGRCIGGTSCTLPPEACTCGGSGGGGGGAAAAEAAAEGAAAEPAPAGGGAAAGREQRSSGTAGLPAPGGGAGGEAGGAAPAAAAARAAPSRRRLAQASDAGSGACDAAELEFCATSFNLAFDGLDAGGAAFRTAVQVRKLNSYSLVALFDQGRGKALELKSKYDATVGRAVGQAWGSFSDAGRQVAAAFTGGRDDRAPMQVAAPGAAR